MNTKHEDPAFDIAPPRAPKVVPPAPAKEPEEPKPTIVQVRAEQVAQSETIIRFRGRAMVMDYEGFPHFVPLHKDRFKEIAYRQLGGITRSQLSDVFEYVPAVVEDLTPYDRYILMGQAENPSEQSVTTVWDMHDLCTVEVPPMHCVWRSPWAKVPTVQIGQTERERMPFILSLAGGDTGLYDDIMQSLAPLVMERKPDGVIWWVGDGANGKSTLMDAIYRLFPGQLSSLTVKRLVDGRDTPSLNGTLANVVKESSEGRIDDTEIYKAVGTHENFRVHKFHSQDDIEIRGNMHHIFSANQVPSFNDKGHSARRRTFIVPFPARFESDPLFEERTFTPEFFGRLLVEMCRYALLLKRQGYKYKWSAATLAAKAEYDLEANNAEEYVNGLINEGVVAFESFQPVRIDYENWCGENGYVPLGVGNIRRAFGRAFERVSLRTDSGVRKLYRLKTCGAIDLRPLGLGRPGLFTSPFAEPRELPTDESVPEPVTFSEPTAQDLETEPAPEPEPERKLILNNRW